MKEVRQVWIAVAIWKDGNTIMFIGCHDSEEKSQKSMDSMSREYLLAQVGHPEWPDPIKFHFDMLSMGGLRSINTTLAEHGILGADNKEIAQQIVGELARMAAEKLNDGMGKPCQS